MWINLKKKTQNPACIFFFFVFLGPHMQHMGVSRVGAESEL